MRTPPAWRDVAAGYDVAADGYDARHDNPCSRARFRIIERPMVEIANRAHRVLELGCGTGRLLSRVRAPVRVGVDISRRMLDGARARIEYPIAADAHALPFDDKCFDAVIAGKGVFRYLDYQRAFIECARVLTRTGRLALHHYAAETWSIRQLRRSTRNTQHSDDNLDIETLDQLYWPARRAGFEHERTLLWRSVRIRPYALPIPVWMPGHFWSHCVLVFQAR